MHRRSFLAGTAASLAMACSKGGKTPASSADPVAVGDPVRATVDDLSLLLEAADFELDGGIGTMTASAAESDAKLRRDIVKEWIAPQLDDLRADTPLDDRSPDLAHLGAAFSDDAFELTHDVMQSIADANHYTPTFDERLDDRVSQQEPAMPSRRVVFGLRGCALADDEGRGGVWLSEARVDHRAMQCVMGVWDRDARTVSAYTASTVPHLFYVQLHRIALYLMDTGDVQFDDDELPPNVERFRTRKETARWGANQLGQGLHVLAAGTHNRRHRNLLRQDPHWFGPVLRAHARLGYHDTDWTPDGPVWDNVHPAWVPDPIAGIFKSGGCQVVLGGGSKGNYRGSIEDLLTDLKAGDSALPRRSPYLLSTGREARLHADPGRDTDALARVRFGSSGLVVERLRDALRKPGRPIVNHSLHGHIVDWQRAQGVTTDGAMTLEQLEAAGVELP